MSHVGNVKDEASARSIRQALIEAVNIIDQLEPAHIDGWADLLAKLDDCRKTAVTNAKLFNPAFKERSFIEGQEQQWEKEEKLQRQINHSFHLTVGIILEALVLLSFVGSITSLPLKTGQFIWWVIFPTAIIGLCFAGFLFITIRRIFRGRKEVPVSELKGFIY